MSDFVSVERINSLKSGIEAKTGETYADLTAGVQALVDGYGQGGGSAERTAWYRPPDMPDYDVLIADKSIFEDDYPDQVDIKCFYTIDTKIPNMTSINPRGYGGTFEIGHFDNGNFVVDETVAFPYDLTRHVERYLIMRHTMKVYSESGKTMSFAFSDKSQNNYPLTPLVEMYGRCNGINLSGNYFINPQKQPTMRYITLWGNVYFGSLSYPMMPTTAEYIDLSHATIPDVNGRFYETVAFSGFKNLHTLLFPNTRRIATLQQYNLQYRRFNNNLNLTELDVSMWDVANIASFQETFDADVSLVALNISGWDMSACTNTQNMFRYCFSLVNLVTDGALMPSVSFGLSDSTLLSADSLVGLIAALPVLDDGVTATLTLGATNTAKLTAEQIAVAAEKGWTLA